MGMGIAFFQILVAGHPIHWAAFYGRPLGNPNGKMPVPAGNAFSARPARSARSARAARSGRAARSLSGGSAAGSVPAWGGFPPGRFRASPPRIPLGRVCGLRGCRRQTQGPPAYKRVSIIRM